VDDEDPDKSPMDKQRKRGGEPASHSPEQPNERQVKSDTELPQKGSA
jgi:hypothetical protein